MTREEIASELEKKREKKLVLLQYARSQEHEKKEVLSMNENNRHALTEKGKKSLEAHLDMFIKTFYDIDEMNSCCRNSRHSNKEC